MSRPLTTASPRSCLLTCQDFKVFLSQGLSYYRRTHRPQPRGNSLGSERERCSITQVPFPSTELCREKRTALKVMSTSLHHLVVMNMRWYLVVWRVGGLVVVINHYEHLLLYYMLSIYETIEQVVNRVEKSLAAIYTNTIQ